MNICHYSASINTATHPQPSNLLQGRGSGGCPVRVSQLKAGRQAGVVPERHQGKDKHRALTLDTCWGHLHSFNLTFNLADPGVQVDLTHCHICERLHDSGDV